MEMITVTAKTLDEAITKALIQLGTTSDNLEYTVIEKGSAGFLGFIGKKDVVIQAKKKKENDLDDIFSLDEKNPNRNSTRRNHVLRQRRNRR